MQYRNSNSFSLNAFNQAKRSVLIGVICLSTALPAAGQSPLNMAQDSVVEEADQNWGGPLNVPSGSQSPSLAPLNGIVGAGVVLNRPGAASTSQTAETAVITSLKPPESLHPEREGRRSRIQRYPSVVFGTAYGSHWGAPHPEIARRDAALAPFRSQRAQPAPANRFPWTFAEGQYDIFRAGLPSGNGSNHLSQDNHFRRQALPYR